MVADIPGLIEGAHTGSGLGTQFLRHIERTRLLVHLVDVSDASGRPDPVKDFEVISEELKSFGAGLENKPVIVVASKIDIANKEKLAKLKRYCKKKNLELFPISAVTGKGIEELKYAMADRVEEIGRQTSSARLQEDPHPQKQKRSYRKSGKAFSNSQRSVPQVRVRSLDANLGYRVPPRTKQRRRRADPLFLCSLHADGEAMAGLLFRTRLPNRAEVNRVEERVIRRFEWTISVVHGAVVIGYKRAPVAAGTLDRAIGNDGHPVLP